MTKGQHTLVIAEAGVNHNGDVGIARRLVEAAAEAGADLIKFQTFTANKIVTATAPKAEYQMAGGGGSSSQIAMLRQLELSPAMHEELASYCTEYGIGFFSTGFDIENIDYLLGLGQRVIKIPSGEMTNLPYLRHVGSLGLEILMSTGMCSLGDIEAAIDAVEAAGTSRSEITVLHCNTEYPTPYSDVNLSAMTNIGKAFGVKIGYSDHTNGIEVPVAAVALGATVIEKHFTLDRTMPGPDHAASLEPAELKAMISAIRNIEQALGDGIKRPTASERKNISIARRSIVAQKTIRQGDLFNADNISAKRPGTGISPMRWDEVVGRVAKRDFAPDELIEL
ncbi:N-acetylneuraminate synthase [Rhizobium sp. CNPSo 3490]|uniref:N-acetylneuraminate synthase n=1 Tax=Rhizobium sp. CNPSo 3490 TaxID=3021407 RepID=UPI00254F15FF|nr:N-acetylneuraminate synthase [Rhizobium sp. CNPSo 3490]MDK4736469.1 N-acetylneuraminate synthase [Rhizobium sp. CNPSo 3490]